ncbi:MAG: hypothetical protein JJU36_17040 [Phycisphaeraceae bacterium]|nr:hypothetical protein [Phycisphaeraceae bacterium]
MNWFIFILFAYVFTVLEVGLETLISPRVDWLRETSPQFLIILLVFIGLNAPFRTALWAGLALGLIADLIAPVTVDLGDDMTLLTYLPGPRTLGYVGAVYFVLQLRGVVYRMSPLATGAATFSACIAMSLISIALWAMRGLPFTPGEPRQGWMPSDALAVGFLDAVYTMLAAMLIHGLFQLARPLWQFQTPAGPGRRVHKA